MEKWIGTLVAEMHLHKITGKQLAKELGYTNEYVSMVLNGKRNPAGAEYRFRQALNNLLNQNQSQIETKSNK